MVPVTILAFKLALMILKYDSSQFLIYDGVGLALVAIGVCTHNIFKEQPQEICIIEGEFKNDYQKN